MVRVTMYIGNAEIPSVFVSEAEANRAVTLWSEELDKRPGNVRVRIRIENA